MWGKRVAGRRDVRAPLPNRKDPIDEMIAQDDLGNRNSSKRLLCPKHSTETTEKTTGPEPDMRLRQGRSWATYIKAKDHP